LDETRYFNALMLLRGTGRGTIVVIPTDDIAPKALWTVIKAPNVGIAPDCVRDWDDHTYCMWEISASSSVDVLEVDLGEPVHGFIRLVSSSGEVQVYASNDKFTWTLVLDVSSPSSESFGYVAGYRYLKLTCYNSASALALRTINSAEFYPAYPLPYARNLNVGGRVVALVYNSY